MKHFVVYILIEFSSIFSYAQGPIHKVTKHIIKYNSGFREDYYVLYDNRDIKEGIYNLTVDDKKLLASGKYSNNHKTGVWNYFNSDGSSICKYNYDEMKLCEIDGKNINDSTFNSIMPHFLGGDLMLLKLLSQNFRLLSNKYNKCIKLAQSDNIAWNVYCKFTIDSLGSINDIKIFKSATLECESLAIELIKSLPKFWLPGITKNRFVNVQFTLPMNFK